MKKWSQTSARTSMRLSPTRGREDGRGKKEKNLSLLAGEARRQFHQLEHGERGAHRRGGAWGEGGTGDEGPSPTFDL